MLLILKNTFAQVFAKGITSIVTLVITIFLARYFGASGYGDFTKVVSLVTLGYILVDFGFNAVFLQEKDISFKTLFYTRLLIAVFLITILNIVVFALPRSVGAIGFSDNVRIGIFVFSLTLFVQSILQSSTAIFQQRKQYEHLFVSVLVGSLVSVCLFFFIQAYSALTLSSALLSLLIGNIITAILSFIFAKQSISLDTLSFGRIKQLCLKSLPLGAMLVFNLVYFRADIIILSFFKSSAEVGTYGLSYRFFDFLLTLPLFLTNALYPHFLDAEKNNRTSAEVGIKFLTMSLPVSLVLIAIFWIASPLLILIDPDFYKAIVPFRILLLSLPLFFASSILQWVLIAKKQQVFLVWQYLIIGTLNVIANVIFIPTYSYIASSIITGLSEALIVVILSLKILHSKNNFHYGKYN